MRLQDVPPGAQVVQAATAALSALEEAAGHLAEQLRAADGRTAEAERRAASLSERLAHSQDVAIVRCCTACIICMRVMHA